MSSDKAVRLYTLSTCLHCKKAKRMLDARAVRYTATDVDLLAGPEREKALAEVEKVNPRSSFPTIIVGPTVIVGFREDEILKALGG
ncbi:glutaredoxin family protein [Thiovibrio sp. JS02]